MKNTFLEKILIITLLLLLSSCTKKTENPAVKQPSSMSSKAIIRTAYGNLEVTFFDKKAPNTVARVQTLIEQGFYNGLTFHRVLPGALVQTGDPTTKGVGGTGLSFKIEKNDVKHLKGSIGMAKLSTSDFVDSQFYICLSDLPELDGDHFIFAKISKGLELLNKIQLGDKIITITLIK